MSLYSVQVPLLSSSYRSIIMSQIVTLQHDYVKDIQRSLKSSIKIDKTLNDVNIHCNDGTVTCDRMLLALASDFWKDVLKSHEGHRIHILAPDHNAELMRQYLHFCVFGYDTEDKETKDDKDNNTAESTNDDKDYNDDSNVLNKENVSFEHVLREFGHQKEKIRKKLDDDSILVEHCSTGDSNKDAQQSGMEIRSFDVMPGRDKSKSWSCPYCLKIYRPGYIKKHIRNVHSEKEKEAQVKCDHCNKKFKTEAGLKAHEKNTHQNKDPHICITCGAVFLNEISLTRHCTTEGHKFSKGKSPKKGYTKCVICNKKIMEERLSIHMEIRHPNGRLHKCKDCTFTTKRVDSLNRHRKLLHGEETKYWRAINKTWKEGKNYKCIYCMRILTTKEDIDSHLVDEICKLTCNICEKRFTLKHHLKRHIMKVHKN